MQHNTSGRITASKRHLARIHSSLEETNTVLQAALTTIIETHAALDVLERIVQGQFGAPHTRKAPPTERA